MTDKLIECAKEYRRACLAVKEAWSRYSATCAWPPTPDSREAGIAHHSAVCARDRAAHALLTAAAEMEES